MANTSANELIKIMYFSLEGSQELVTQGISLSQLHQIDEGRLIWRSGRHRPRVGAFRVGGLLLQGFSSLWSSLEPKVVMRNGSNLIVRWLDAGLTTGKLGTLRGPGLDKGAGRSLLEECIFQILESSDHNGLCSGAVITLVFDTGGNNISLGSLRCLTTRHTVVGHSSTPWR
jgi:hypothetical protein